MVQAVSLVFGKYKFVLADQSSRPIARKELVAALNTAKLLKQASEALQKLNCSDFSGAIPVRSYNGLRTLTCI